MSKRTWMKVTDSGGSVMWAGIDGDCIRRLRWLDEDVEDAHVRMRADDTLSRWVSLGDTIEGPFDEPE